ncbi:MAG: hypothetical protein AB7E96_02410 [Deferribacterales bacterium]
MNRNKKKLTVRFYEIESNEALLNDISAVYQVSIGSGEKTRIINHKEKKYFIKLDKITISGRNIYSITVVKERNTWQTKALRDGTISGIQINQGIIGDPYYYLLDSDKKVIFGLTTGGNEGLRTVGETTLTQFQKDRLSKIALNPIMKKDDSAKINHLSNIKNFELKVDFSELGEIDTYAPNTLRELSIIARNAEIHIKYNHIEDENGLPERELVEIVDFLNENDACSKLTVEGEDIDGEPVKLDFHHSLFVYREEIETRNNYIDENSAHQVLINASEMLNDLIQ